MKKFIFKIFFFFVTFCQSKETPLPTKYDDDDDAIMKIAKIQMYVQYVVVFT